MIKFKYDLTWEQAQKARDILSRDHGPVIAHPRGWEGSDWAVLASGGQNRWFVVIDRDEVFTHLLLLL